jgi:hypothetical protein
MRYLALQRALGHYDAVGWNFQHNLYALFRGDLQRWQFIPWDLDVVFGLQSIVATDEVWPPTSLATKNPPLNAMVAEPEFRRAYLRGLKEASDGPLTALAQATGTIIDIYRDGLLANSVSPNAIEIGVRKTWISNRKNFLVTRYVSQDATFGISTIDYAATATTGSIIGQAMVAAVTIEVVRSGAVVPATPIWSADANDKPVVWALDVPLNIGANAFTIRAKSGTGQVLGTGLVTITRQ